AAMASRINVVPLAGVLAPAALVRMLPAFEIGYDPVARWRLIGRLAAMLALGAAVSLLVFRLAQPYAFTGPSVLNVGINPSWMSQMLSVQMQVSGQVDFPPNHQWALRTPYLFPLRNMIQWGMGAPLGSA